MEFKLALAIPRLKIESPRDEVYEILETFSNPHVTGFQKNVIIVFEGFLSEFGIDLFAAAFI